MRHFVLSLITLGLLAGTTAAQAHAGHRINSLLHWHAGDAGAWTAAALAVALAAAVGAWLVGRRG